eukprot:gene17406-23706_t
MDTKVLVYCMSGTSRSPTVVIGYLMKVKNWRLAESYKWVKSKRSSVSIQPALDTGGCHEKGWQHLTQVGAMKMYGSTSTPQGLAALGAGGCHEKGWQH